MPLKFLKRCRQYNVTSKNLFVISVHHLLDAATTVDCTISSESKGQECLDNVCQRLFIQQPEFFGLRYLVKGKEAELKWIDLERSLSRQLEKYAAGTKIYLRVRHYVTTGVRHLSDESSRYYYFLQLKNDIYEGKFVCDIRTAILLALYCRQAEYDSYQNDKQNKDYLKKSLVLPKNLQGLSHDDNLLDSLIIDVLNQNAGIQHLPQSQAEEMYIQCCQQLDGYGEERFNAKDTLGNDILLGLAINGMVVTAENGRQYFPWKDFTTVTIDKRTIKIEQNKGDASIVGSFIFTEAEMARYFWKLCITQHKFFKRYIDEDSASMGDVESSNGVSIGNGAEAMNASAFSYEFNDSREDLLLEQQRATYTTGGTATAISAGHEYLSAHSLQLGQNMTSHGLVASTNSSAIMMSSSNISLTPSHQSGGGGNNGMVHAQSAGVLGQNWMNKEYSQEYMCPPHLSSGMLDARVQSSSCLDLTNNNLTASNSMVEQIGSSNVDGSQLLLLEAQERERLKAMLPTYRAAPDYETAVQLKYRTPSAELHAVNNISMPGASKVLSNYYAGSQPDVHNAGVYSDGVLLAAHRYPDVTQPAAAMHAQHQHLNNVGPGGSSMVIPTNMSLNPMGGSNMYMDMSHRLPIMRSNPPPPYPVNRLSSSSTPDLAIASHRPLLGYRTYVSGSSPDLVSNRNLYNQQCLPYVGGGIGVGANALSASTNANSVATIMHKYSYGNHMGHSQQYLPPHGTFENLNMIEEQPSIMTQLRQSALNQAQAASQSYEPNMPIHQSVAYCSSSALAGQQQPQQQQQRQSPSALLPHSVAPAPLQRNAANGSIEPIYENVPLPQYCPATTASVTVLVQRNADQRSSGSSHTSEAMRIRNASIQSAPPATIHGQPPVPAARSHHHEAQQHNRPAGRELSDSAATVPFLGAGRAASSEVQVVEPTPPQRAIRATSAAPSVGGSSPGSHPHPLLQKQTPPPRHNKSLVGMKSGGSSIAGVDGAQLSPSHAAIASTSTLLSTAPEDVLQHQFGAMNLSSASASASSVYTNSTLDTSRTTSHSHSTASGSSTAKDGKRKKRWNLLGRSKTPDKQKSATLGRERSTAVNAKVTKAKSAQDDLNIPPYRWSTGVTKLQPISGQFSKDKLCQILDDKLNDSQLYMEFEAIPKRREEARYDCALMDDNAPKNSNPNFLPYDDNRVRITPTMDNRHGYVNASHISATVGTKQRFYILSQSPNDNLTARIFWQCVWEADVYLVLQLSEGMNYTPLNSNQRLEFGQFQVYQEFSQATDRCITSKLRLFHIQSRRYRSVWHLNYTDWGEQNCPRDVNHYLKFLEYLNSVRMASIDEVPPGHNTNPPVFIHCYEGGGRSGVTLTADLLLYTLDHNEDLDIPRVVDQLRHQRDSIIPSLAQYKFIYNLLITYLKRTRLI